MEQIVSYSGNYKYAFVLVISVQVQCFWYPDLRWWDGRPQYLQKVWCKSKGTGSIDFTTIVDLGLNCFLYALARCWPLTGVDSQAGITQENRITYGEEYIEEKKVAPMPISQLRWCTVSANNRHADRHIVRGNEVAIYQRHWSFTFNDILPSARF